VLYEMTPEELEHLESLLELKRDLERNREHCIHVIDRLDVEIARLRATNDAKVAKYGPDHWYIGT